LSAKKHQAKMKIKLTRSTSWVHNPASHTTTNH